MKIKKGFILREVAGNYIVVSVGEMVKQFNGVINLNQTGAFLWKFFSEEHTLEDGVNALCAEYEVEREIAQKDVEKFIEVLSKSSFLE